MTGLHIEGARWSIKHNSLAKSLPNVLTEPLPILAIIPIEEHRLELQVLANLFSITEDVRTRFVIAPTHYHLNLTVFFLSLPFSF